VLGSNSNGRLGDGTTDPHLRPNQVVGMNDKIRGLAVGEAHSCAIKGTTGRCWGYKGSGGLGDGTEDESWVPVRALL